MEQTRDDRPAAPDTRRTRRRGPGRQGGATLAEFLAVAPIVLGIGGGTVQTGLLYHGKTTLNYATFEAARAGAVHHAQRGPMLEELGLRLAPLEGGTGELAGAAAAIVKSKLAVQGPFTRISVLNPTAEAFAEWGERSVENGRRVIPNSHLRHRGAGVKAQVSLQDANLLKIEVVHGIELKVPLVGGLLAAAMTRIDPENAAFYRSNRFPLKSVATVRMQSEAWEQDYPAMAAAPGGGAETIATASELAGGGAAPQDVVAGETLPGGPGLGDIAGDIAGSVLCGAGPPLDMTLPLMNVADSCAGGPGGARLDGALGAAPSSPSSTSSPVAGC